MITIFEIGQAHETCGGILTRSQLLKIPEFSAYDKYISRA